MSSVKILNLSSVEELRSSISSFSGIAIESASTFDSVINNRMQTIHNLVESLRYALDNAKVAYSSAIAALKVCEDQPSFYDEDGYEYPPDCSYEENDVRKAYRKYKSLQAKYDNAIFLKSQADDWKVSYDIETNRFKYLSGNVSQNSLMYLGKIIQYCHEYINLSKAYESNDNLKNENINSSQSRKKELPQDIKSKGNATESNTQSNQKYGGYSFNVSTTESKSANGNRFTQWSIGSASDPNGNFLSLKMSHLSKVGTINDIKTSSGILATNSDASFALGLAEKLASRSGCEILKSYIPKSQLSFFRDLGYSVNSDDDINVEVYKKI